MIPLVIAIVVLSVSILISRQFILIKEWYVWAYMLTETYMKDELESRKLEVLKTVGYMRFPITTTILPQNFLCRFVQYVKKDFMDHDNAMKNYNRLVQGISLYDKDYSFLLHLIEDVGKKEEA